MAEVNMVLVQVIYYQSSLQGHYNVETCMWHLELDHLLSCCYSALNFT